MTQPLPRDYHVDAGVRLTFDTLVDRGHNPVAVIAALDDYQGDLWFDVFGPAVDTAGEYIGVGAYPEVEDDETG